MSIGDGAVLGKLFSHLHRKEQIPAFLHAVQAIREPRVKSVLKASLGNIFAVSLPPGIAEQRDRELHERAQREVRNLGTRGSQTTSEEMVKVRRVMSCLRLGHLQGKGAPLTFWVGNRGHLRLRS